MSALVVPYIAKATELALGQVPVAYREGVRRSVWRGPTPVYGELVHQSSGLVLAHSLVGYLTYAASTTTRARTFRALSADASLMLLVIVIALIMSSRTIVRLTQSYAPNRAIARGGRAERAAMRAAQASPSKLRVLRAPGVAVAWNQLPTRAT